MIAPLIDVRAQESFVAAHAPGSASIPLEELADRSHELPMQGTALRVMDGDAERARRAAQILQTRGHPVTIVPLDQAALTETGEQYARLWQPNEFLLEALAQIKQPASASLRALDVACGSGRDAVYLALQGYQVEAIDVLPDALAKATDLARRCGVTLTTRVVDLERDQQLPRERYDPVVVFRYLQRSLFAALADAVKPGGYIIYETFHERNLLTNKKPRNPSHLLKDGELCAAFGGFQILIHRDGVERQGRVFSSLLARKPECD
jgi:tellurite methyltransferase